MTQVPQPLSSRVSWGWMLLLLAVGLSLRLSTIAPPFAPDTFGYTCVAMGGGAVPRFASRYGLIWPLAVLVRLFGETPHVLVIYPAFCSTATLLVTYLLGRRLVGESASRWGTLLLALTPVEVAYGTNFLPDVCAVFWVSLAFLAAVRSLDTGRLAPLLVVSLASYVGIQTKEVVVAIVPVFLWLAWRAAAWRGVSVLLLGFLGTASFDAWACWWLWGDPLWKVRAFLEAGLNANVSASNRGFLDTTLIGTLFSSQMSHATVLPIAVASLCVPAVALRPRRILVWWLASTAAFLVFCDLRYDRLAFAPRYFAHLSVPMALLGGAFLQRLLGPCRFRVVLLGIGACIGVYVGCGLLSADAARMVHQRLVPSLLAPTLVCLLLAFAPRVQSCRRGPLAAFLAILLALQAGLWTRARNDALISRHETEDPAFELIGRLPAGSVHLPLVLGPRAAFWSGFTDGHPFCFEEFVPRSMSDASFRVPLWAPLRTIHASVLSRDSIPGPRYWLVHEGQEEEALETGAIPLFRRDLRLLLWDRAPNAIERFLAESRELASRPTLAEARARVFLAAGRPEEAVAEIGRADWEEDPSGQMALLCEQAAVRAGSQPRLSDVRSWMASRELLVDPAFDDGEHHGAWKLFTRPCASVTMTSGHGPDPVGGVRVDVQPSPIDSPRPFLWQQVRRRGSEHLVAGWSFRMQGFPSAVGRLIVRMQLLDPHGKLIGGKEWSPRLRDCGWRDQSFSLERPQVVGRSVRLTFLLSGDPCSRGSICIDRVHLLRMDAGR